MGVVLSRKTGAGALKRPVLVVLGLRPDGKIVDYRLARAESTSSTLSTICWMPPSAACDIHGRCDAIDMCDR